MAEAPTITRRYLIRDNLGSVSVILDDNLADGLASSILSSPSYEAFGAQADSTRFNASADVANMTRGYTDHEQFDDLGIIHMNGRIYDADLGRFLSADPLVPHPYFSQSYNRYSYVMNNPLTLTDPSGFEDDKCGGVYGDIPLEDADKYDLCVGFGSCDGGGGGGTTPAKPITVVKTFTTASWTEKEFVEHKWMNRFQGGSERLSRDWEPRKEYVNNVGSAVAPDAVASGEVGGWLDNLQLGLDVAGLTPGLGAVADATNAVIHLARGNWAGAALSSIAIIPIIGDAAVLAKMADRAGDAARSGVQANRQAGKAGEDFLNSTYGGGTASMNTSLGWRHLDNLSDGIARESKVGRTSLTARVERQIQKDSELLNSRQVDSVEWHFFPGKTGTGPTGPLRERLEGCGMTVCIHP